MEDEMGGLGILALIVYICIKVSDTKKPLWDDD